MLDEENLMKIKSIERTSIPDVVIITPEIFKDDRGYFYESFNTNDFKDLGLPTTFVQDNQAYSKKDTLRGFHYQLRHQQGKLVRAISGEVFDVVIDIRKGSPTFGQSAGVILSEINQKIMFIPKGFAHAYLVLSKDAIFQYKCTDVYHPEDEHGIRWNDPDLNVGWPIEKPILSEKDSKLPLLKNVKDKKLPKYIKLYE